MAFWKPLSIGKPEATAVLLAALLATGVPAAAGQESETQVRSIDESLLFLDLGTVTAASRYEQETGEAPSSITILTAEDIRNYGFQDVAEALNSVHGFWVNNDRNYSYLGVRGFSVPGDYNSRVLVMIDGQVANDSIYNAAGFGTEEIIDISLVERIEIIRGPGSSLYGTSAVFGVVNIVTHKGRRLEGGTVEIGGGSWGAGRLATTFGTRTDNGLDVLVGASAYRRGGPDLYFPEFDDPATNNGLAVGLDDDRYTRAFAKVGFRNLTFDALFASRTKGIPTASFETVFGGDTWALDASGYARVTSEQTFDDLSRLKVDVSYNRYLYDGQYEYEDGISTDGADGHWIRATSQYDRRVGNRHRLLVGGELLHNMKALQWADWEGEPVFRSDERGTPWGIFVQDEVRLTPNVRFTFGLRHDRYHSFGGTTNPRAALVWTPSNQSAVKLLYGTAFRAPNHYELYYDDDGFQTKRPDGLEPERIRSFEVVVEHQFRPGLRATVSAFHMDLDDLTGQVIDPADGLFVFRNVESARTTGFEFGADFRSNSGISAAGGYTLQSAEDSISGVTRYNAPRHLAKGRVSVPVAGDRARASLIAQYVSSQTNVWNDTVPAYTVADLAVTTWLRSSRLALDVKVVNLFDAEYGTPPSVDIALTTVPQDRRSIRVGLRVVY